MLKDKKQFSEFVFYNVAITNIFANSGNWPKLLRSKFNILDENNDIQVSKT